MKKLTTKIDFHFDEQSDVPMFNVDMKIKTKRNKKSIKIVEYKRKKKTVDASTKLF